jgi:PhzF family phenazine biosynthesis protein
MTSTAHRVVWTSVFSAGPGGGNPCPVVFDADDLSADQLQELARGFGVETAFVLAPRAGGDVWLRFFVPRHEMEMCVHATVASTVLLGRAGRLPQNPARVETGIGVLDVSWERATAVVDQLAPTFGPAVAGAARQRVLDALRITEGELDGAPIRSVSTSRPKLIVPLRDEATIDRLAPDVELLWAVCDELDVTGFYPFARPAREADVAARQFPRRVGYDEDPATGVAAGALAAYLASDDADGATGWRRWLIAQGRAMGRPSLITAEALLSAPGTVTATRVGGQMELTAAPG